MVHINRLELTNFKSFGGTTSIPVLPGFTVVTGPNGSGKSNILDALLFCLGISTSKGMRAERLPDLVNHNLARSRTTVEASVTVTFDLEGEGLPTEEDYLQEAQAIADPGPAQVQPSEEPQEQNGTLASPGNEAAIAESDPQAVRESDPSNEWSITRRLRVTKAGTYTSTYYINGQACTLSELHEQMNRMRIYPEGYNVVLQGDVTAIISMNARERRTIIDELAGVAAFDRKIAQAKDKLDEVKEREDRCRIVEQELISQRDRLAKDRDKAQKYQALRAQVQEKELLEAVLQWHQLNQQEWKLREQIEAGDREAAQLRDRVATASGEIQQANERLEELNARVKALGEEELLAKQSVLAQREAEKEQQGQRLHELQESQQQQQRDIAEAEREIGHYQQKLEQVAQERQESDAQLKSARQLSDELQQDLDRRRERASAIAAASEEWVQQQTALHRQIETLQKSLDPQRTEQARLGERVRSLDRAIAEQHETLQDFGARLAEKKVNLGEVDLHHQAAIDRVQSLAGGLAAAENDLKTQQDTEKRLLDEQREKQRRLDKLEAQTQALREASGTGASQVIVQAGLQGVCGLVAELGRVDPHYQLALETAAGGRLAYLVVEDDAVAASAIQLLKQKRAGRATFLPLNKIRPPRFSPIAELRQARGFVDYAVNLIECDRPYLQVFAYVFGNTVVFETLDAARSHMGKTRIVTLDGELLETSGAMTGGSSSHRSSLHFGTGGDTESAEVTELKERLEQIEQILQRCGEAIAQAAEQVKGRSQELIDAKQQQRELQLKTEQLQGEIDSLSAQQQQVRQQLADNTQELTAARDRLQVLDGEIPSQEARLQQWRHELSALEESGTNSEWQGIQAQVRQLESELQDASASLRAAQSRRQDLDNQQQRLDEKRQETRRRLEDLNHAQINLDSRIEQTRAKLGEIDENIAQNRRELAEIEAKLGEDKQARDRAEEALRQLHLARQQIEWQGQKLQESQDARREQLGALREQIAAGRAELPDPVPPVPEESKNRLVTALQELQKEVRSLQKQLKAMEPVNMLALEEYDRTQTRLEELQSKLATLEGERTELLLRIENFTTLRLRAFKEAFDAVNENFQTIFADLSEGDGYLQLDDPEDPFSSGLNLVAHPKGKPVQRLAAMSGGEKSMTALSFIFALQRYRPSPFYAFDEVDMFLDGANVERLAKMIKQQVQRAQFIVVSHKTPMIKAAERVIGVTQARGAHTQVVGLNLESNSAPV